MTLLAINEAEFMDVVSGINTNYNAYKDKNIINYCNIAFIYKVKNYGFNNYKFSDKMINDDIDELES